jgi:autotransporter-associated beta strand protein
LRILKIYNLRLILNQIISYQIYFKLMRKFYLCFTVLIGTIFTLNAQQDVFSRDNVPTGNFGDGLLPWFYPSGGNQGDPDNGGSTRNFVKIGHNNNTTMTTNGRFYIVNTLDFQAAATSARTINNSGGGLSASGGIYNASSATHVFNTPIGIDGSTVQIHSNSTGGMTFNDNIFINANTVQFGNTGTGVITVNGTMQGTGNVEKNGTNNLIVTGSHTYSGSTTINAGRLILQGDVANSVFTVKNGATLEIDASVTVNGITVEGGGALIVNSGKTLTVTGTVTLNSTSTLYSSLIVNGTATGDITYNRYTAEVGPTGTNDLIASPFSGQTFGAFATANDGVLAASGTLRAFAPFDPVNNIYTNYDTSTNANTPITPGIGYRAATNSGQTLAFTGTPNNGAVAVTLQDNTSFWNLIGNPYPSYIDIGDFLAENVATTNINASFYGVYGYDGDVTNGWTVWDLNVKQDLLIAPGQGFFVAAPSGGGSGIDFTTAMRRTGSGDDFIAGRNTTSDANFAHAILNLNTASASYGTNVYFRDINTLGLDPGYDTGAFDQTANGIYSHLVAGNTGIALANQSLPFTSLSDQSVPLVVNANAGEQLTFSLNTDSNIPSNINVYLEDQLAGSVTLLNSSAYVLTPASNLSGPGRFYVVFSDNALTTTEQHLDHVTVYTNQSTRTINISGQLDEGSMAKVFDIQGREIITQKLSSESILQRISSDDLSTGVYIVKLYTKTKSKSVKLVIR